jgi:hypothetical protein
MHWKTEDPGGALDFSAIVGMDPYANWLLNWGWSDFSRCEREPIIPFVVALLDDVTVKIMEDNSRPRHEGDGLLPILIPALNSPFALHHHIAAFARRQFFVDLATSGDKPYLDFRKAIKRIKLGLPLKPEQQQELKALGPGEPLAHPPQVAFDILPQERRVVIGIIDDGIAFAHDRFRASAFKTRIAYFWRQDGPFAAAAAHGPVSTVPYGREIAAADGNDGSPGIDTLLRECSRGGIVDEDRVYARFGSMDFRNQDHKSVARRYAHGTHILDLAAGAALAEAPTDRPIIAVQLPVATTADTSGTTLEVYVKHAINYIAQRAELLRGKDEPPLPVVINFSYGVTAGPHDGTSVVEQEIDEGIGKKGELTFILPAGNAQLSRGHARVCWNGAADDPDDDPAVLPWRVLPNGLTTSQLEIWLPRREKGNGDRVRITIETPAGLQSEPLGEVHGREVVLYDDDGVTAIAAASYSHEAAPTDRGLFLISLRPTEHLRPLDADCGREPDAPAGGWKVRIWRGPAYGGEDVEPWIQRNDTPFGYPIRGRQSYFDECSYLRYDPISGRPLEDDPASPPCHVKRVSLINAIATGCKPVVVGGVFGEELVPAEYSAGGPTWTDCAGGGRRTGPDVSAVSDDSRIHRGVLGAGSRSGSAFTLSGTSVAAPQIARSAANLAAGADHEIGRNDVVAAAQAVELPEPGWPALSPQREGQGRIVGSGNRPGRIGD